VQRPIATEAAAAAFDVLRRSFAGQLITPGDPGYDEAARAGYYGGEDARPTLIARPSRVDDVVVAVGMARQTGLELAVRSGGHSVAHHSSTDAGILLDLAGLRQFDVDLEGRAAWAGAGLTAGEVTSVLAEHGLAVPFGDTGSVGIGGISLGGGIGYLARRFGLTIDSVIGAEIVTADGRILEIDDRTHPELFWAIRGGGGGFGVVTRFRYRLREVPEVVGGMLVLPATADTLAGFLAASDAAPDELTAIAAVMMAPPMPFLPPAAHGRPILLTTLTFTGPVDAAGPVLAPFRALATPLADMVRPVRYPELFIGGPAPERPIAAARSMFLDRVDTGVAGRILDRVIGAGRPVGAQMVVAQLRVMGGAIARVPAGATAYAHRGSHIMLNIVAGHDGSPATTTELDAWAERARLDFHQQDEGVYVYFLGEEGPARLQAAYPNGAWDRLVAVKRRYDPDNLFHRTHTVTPT
jgi:FAD/FMN-containing dehydrogenase